MKYLLAFVLSAASVTSFSQDINDLLQKVKTRLESVNDYEASGVMKTNVSFLKVPVANVKVYFKKPNRLKVKSEKGVSFIPKGAVNINMSNLIGTNNFTVIDAGKEILNGQQVRVAKLLPQDDNNEIVLSTLYIDEANALIKKSRTTTRDNGTYELSLTYGKYASYGLPDKLVFSFNTKDYKLPKGMTFDFDDGSKQPAADKMKNKKGSAEITFKSYLINKGVSDDLFK